jgi:hypothetical protein
MKKNRSFLFAAMVAVMAMALPSTVAMAGEGSSNAEFNDPSEYYAAMEREAAASADYRPAAINDPSEYYVAMEREAAAAAANAAFPSFAGSYSDLRLAASDAGAVAVSDGNWNDPSEYYAALEREAREAAESESCEVC